jgi:two-component system, cell cycle sensor histidine kinase and response regulator CckA
MVIGGRCQLAIERLPQGHPLAEELREVLKASQRAATLTRQLLAFSRRQILQPRVLDLRKVVKDLEDMLSRLMGENVTVSITASPDAGRVKADPGQIEQVLLNLAVNARDAMPQGGRLDISIANLEVQSDRTPVYQDAQPGRYVLLSVSDTGCGMTPEVRSRVFEPFFTTKPVGRGTGLGLSSVYGIVKQSGGYITVWSSPGKGATFRIALPRVTDAADRGSRMGSAITVAKGSETILLAEDEQGVRDLIEDALREQGYRVLTATNEDEALLRARTFDGTIHLLLTDLVMHNIGGKELAARLKALRPKLRVIFISGYASEALIERGMMEPGVAFLQKPISLERLIRKVRHELERPAANGPKGSH